jgi:NAD(P)-dependent dehydrogenase (short-subunit alcohol dehydrogenase family)/acyl dehydratase/putative sterol carrier protein
MGSLLHERVVLVTGAGNGIGRAHALALAREGARVVVNDLGGARDGTGRSSAAADEVVAAIVAAGGDAVANADSVTDPEGCARMVQAANDRWGRLDAVVNNAGILRDRTFARLTDEEWDLVVAVHLRGTYNVIRAALPDLQARGGAIVNTTSYSGLIGNFGQSNYGAAKAGVYGLSRVLALELQRSGVTVNCVAPIAKTRMTAEIGMVDAEWVPEQISPVVVYLCSPLAKGVTGRVFGVQGQRIHVYEMKTNDGVEKPGPALWTAEEIAERLGDITSFDAGKPAAAAEAGPSPVKEVFALAPSAYRAERAGDFAARIHFAVKEGGSQTLVIGGGRCVVEEGLTGTPDCTVKTDTETIVGIFKQTVDAQKAFMKGRITADNLAVMMKFAMYFDFTPPKPAAPVAADAGTPVADAPERTWPIGKVYDGGFAFAEPAHAAAYAAATGDDSPAYVGAAAICPPMFHVRLFKALMFTIAADPELGLDLLRLVHGEHDATFHHPIRPWDLVQLRARLESVEEKSSGLLVVSRMYGFVEGRLAVECRTAYFVRGRKKPEEAKTAAREPALEVTPLFTAPIGVAPDQSLRYAAASLDDNPIHTDAATALAAGLPGVILQGLCTMAMTAAAVVRAAADNDARRLARFSVRFARPVLNDSTLTTVAWPLEGGRLGVETRDAAGNLVLSAAIAELRR